MSIGMTQPKILDSILDHVGNTPMVRLNRIAKAEGLECELLAKCEYFNAGGSIKDRIAKRMLEEAERKGLIQPGVTTIIEPTSGNTGVGLALAGAVKGYRIIITLPERMSNEKVDVMRALGAEVIRTPSDADWDSPESHLGVAKRLHAEIPNSIILDQYSNPENPLAHYFGTAEEILEACDGKIDMFVAGAGTGGTVTGVARKLKEKCPEAKIIAVDPLGSVLSQSNNPDAPATCYQVEGIGYSFLPDVLNLDCVDEWYTSTDKESFLNARRLIRDEGILCGGSSGSALSAALAMARSLKKGQRCVVILPDSVRNYMTRFLSDDWMRQYNYLDEPVPQPVVLNGKKVNQWGSATVKDLELGPAVTVLEQTTCREASKIMRNGSHDQLPVTSSTGNLTGLVTLDHLLSQVASGHINPDSPVSAAMLHSDHTTSHLFREITVETPLAELEPFLEKNNIAVVTTPVSGTCNGTTEVPLQAQHVITKLDLVSYLMNRL